MLVLSVILSEVEPFHILNGHLQVFGFGFFKSFAHFSHRICFISIMFHLTDASWSAL